MTGGENEMSKFKVGDRVRAIKNVDDEFYDRYLGKEFDVVEVCEENGTVDINAPGKYGDDYTIWKLAELELVVEGDKVSKFKVGDKVRVVKNLDNPFFDMYIGKEHSVLEVNERKRTVKLDTPSMGGNEFTTWDFSEIELTKENKMSFFRVGDRVRVVKNVDGGKIYDACIGKEYDVLRVFEDSDSVEIDAVCEFGNNSSTWNFSELELVSREGEVVGTAKVIKTKTMKTLEMLIAAETSGKTYKNERIYYSKKMGFVDSMNMPWAGYAFTHLNEIIHDDGQFSDGWKEIVELSETERTIAKSLKGKWIARDSNGNVFTYNNKPKKGGKVWEGAHSLSALSHLFPMIIQEGDAILIEDLLKGEV